MTRALASAQTWAEMVKLSHSVFALPFAVMGAFLAGREIEGLHRPHWGQLGLVVVCMVAARGMSMTFNRIVDAGIDARNPRTAGRPLPTGVISMPAAVGFLMAVTVAFLAACVAFGTMYGNHWPILLSPGVILLLCGYSYTKRFTQWSHFVLGAAIGLSPAAAWIAVDPGSLGWSAGLLSAAVMLWIAGFDIIYACQDADHDRREGLYSLPARVGLVRALWIARTCHASVVVLLVALAVTAPLGWLYLLGVFAVAALLVIENSLVRPDDLSRVNVAFFTMNGIVSLGLGTLAILDMYVVTPAS